MDVCIIDAIIQTSMHAGSGVTRNWGAPGQNIAWAPYIPFLPTFPFLPFPFPPLPSPYPALDAASPPPLPSLPPTPL